jgi:hypothetical protein
MSPADLEKRVELPGASISPAEVKLNRWLDQYTPAFYDRLQRFIQQERYGLPLDPLNLYHSRPASRYVVQRDPLEPSVADRQQKRPYEERPGLPEMPQYKPGITYGDAPR